VKVPLNTNQLTYLLTALMITFVYVSSLRGLVCRLSLTVWWDMLVLDGCTETCWCD